MSDSKKQLHTKTYVGGTDSTARFMSICSVVIALAAFYFTTLAPADIKVSFIEPEFQFQSFPESKTVPLTGGLEAVRGKSSFLLIANCIFANNGAEIGDVSAVAIQFVSDDGTTWSFAPFKTLDDFPRIADPDGRVGYDYKKIPPFSPILLPGKQTSHHTFLFLLEDATNFIPTPHTFHVTLWVWYGLSPTPHKQQTSTLDFNDYVVAQLKTGGLGAVPFEEQRQQIHRLMNVK